MLIILKVFNIMHILRWKLNLKHYFHFLQIFEIVNIWKEFTNQCCKYLLVKCWEISKRYATWPLLTFPTIFCDCGILQRMNNLWFERNYKQSQSQKFLTSIILFLHYFNFYETFVIIVFFLYGKFTLFTIYID